MKTVELLIEIGCEEIPARMLPAGAKALADGVIAILDKAGLAHGVAQLSWTPRRLALRLPDTAAATEPTRETLLGPPARAAWDADGNPTKAAMGFASKQGLDASALEKIETERGVYAAAVVERPARPLGEVLAADFERAVSAISFPKMMRWGMGASVFVRPVHWLVALADDQVLPLTLFGVEAGRTTRGHRALAPEPIEVADAASWATALAEHGKIEVDPVVRRESLHERLRAEARRVGGELVEDEALLAESADMVELPAALAGSFEDKFVEGLPREVLATCLRHHQKAFSIASGDQVLARFAVAVNMPEDPDGHICRGHEWVNSGRLEDALFFWREDRKAPLEARAESLSGVVFQQELGTYAEKSRRVAALTAELAESAGASADERAALTRASELARCDLVTGLVGEFPELQGVVGGLLARADGVDEETVQAIYHLYRPHSVEDALPPTRAGQLLGLADRLDTLAGGFAVGLAPTGSRDPFALRRAGLAAVRLAAALGIELGGALETALGVYSGGDRGPDLRETAGEALPALVTFLLERFGALAEREGARYDEIAAVKAVAARGFEPGDLFQRAAALKEFRGSEVFLALAGASKRIRNILAQAAERGDAAEPAQRSECLALAAEQDLAENLGRAGQNVADCSGRGDHGGALRALAELRPTVDRFFDEVLVMDEDEGKRLARLGLLASFQQLAHAIVDLSELVVDGK